MNFNEQVDEEAQLLRDIEKALKPILEKGSLDEFQQGLNAQAKADSTLQLAYQFSSLYFVYLKLNGIDPKNNPIMKEIERIQTQFKRYQQLTQPQQQRTATIDKPAVKRILQHEMNQRQQLGEQYQRKQEQLMEEEQDYSKRLELHNKDVEKVDLDIWKQDEQKKQDKQVLVKGSLMPKVGHLNWKSEIEKIMK